jgi:hypothetical protein
MSCAHEALADFPLAKEAPWITRFGADPKSWNIAEPEDDPDSDESGMPGKTVVENGLMGWAQCWGGWPGDAIAARVFNLPMALVQAARPSARALAAAMIGHDPAGSEISEGLGLWIMARGEQTVGDAARAFNQHPVRIVEVVSSDMWMFVSGNRDDVASMTIEMDGE